MMVDDDNDDSVGVRRTAMMTVVVSLRVRTTMAVRR